MLSGNKSPEEKKRLSEQPNKEIVPFTVVDDVVDKVVEMDAVVDSVSEQHPASELQVPGVTHPCAELQNTYPGRVQPSRNPPPPEQRQKLSVQHPLETSMLSPWSVQRAPQSGTGRVEP